MHRRSKRILTVIGIIIVIFGVLYAIALLRSTQKLRRAYAALEADGRPMRAAEIIPPQVPAPQNAAVLYQSAALMLKGQPAGEKNLLDQIETLSRNQKNSQAELKELIGRDIVADAVAMVEQGTRRPVCQFDRDYGGSLEMDLAVLNHVRSLAYVLWTKARWEAQAGNKDRAWHLVMTALRLGDSLRSDPVPQGQFNRMAIIRRTCGLIQDLCETAPPSAQDYAAIESVLKGLDDIAPLIRAVDGERLLIGEWFFNLPRAKLDEVLWKDAMHSDDVVPMGIQKAVYRVMFTVAAFRPRLITDHAAYLELMNRRVQLLRDPYQGESAYRARNQVGIGSFLTHKLTGFGYDRGFYCSMVAALRMTRAGLALIRYKQAHGQFPPTLEALGLEGLLDPYAETPLRYRVEGEGFLVYSVGSDQEDNGGTPRPAKQDSDPRRKRVNYDLVWRYPKPAEPANE